MLFELDSEIGRGDIRDTLKPKVSGKSAKRRARRVPFPTPDGPNTTRGRFANMGLSR